CDRKELKKDSRHLHVSVPKFDKVPWLSETSHMNKPLVLSLPRRSAHPFTTFLASTWKDEGLPALFQVPDVSLKARKNQRDLMSLRHKRLCSACQEKKMVMDSCAFLLLPIRMMNLHQCGSQTEPKPSHENMATESVPCKLPILGPRTAVFYGMLSDAYKALEKNQHSLMSRKDPGARQ
uniref:Chromosome 1 open reading frame 105 n=1 Tax=Urocitellus parryii TaxID=9999 RepID=A0A8D2GNK2_UROPR